MYVFISVFPIFRQPNQKAFRTFGNKDRIQIRPFFHHRPGFRTPFICIGMKEIRHEAGIYIIAIRLQFIFSLPVFLYGKIQGSRLGNDRGILAKLHVSPIYITVITTGTDFGTAMPGFHVAIQNASFQSRARLWVACSSFFRKSPLVIMGDSTLYPRRFRIRNLKSSNSNGTYNVFAA